MSERIHMITIGVEDIADSENFYLNVFGWEKSKASNQDVVFFKSPGVIFGLYSRQSLAEDAGVSPDGAGFKGVAFAHNVKEKDEVALFLKRAEKYGGKIVKDAQDVFWGGFSGYFSDIDGHLWEVAWNPHFAINEDGAIELP